MTSPFYYGRYVFIAGLHRTGTSLTARLLAHHPNIASITGSPAPEDEGCYLQGAIPHTALHGIPGRYAADPAQHLIEGCQYDTLAVRERIAADWGPWFTPQDAEWRAEKSPVNLTRMRLYQQLFPMCQFVIVLRHPAAMAAALAKWVDTPAADLIDYALDAYDLMAGDLDYLHAAMTVRYEDLIAQPRRTIAAMSAFLDLAPPPMEDQLAQLRDGNADYPGAVTMSDRQSERAARWGYAGGLRAAPWSPTVRHPLRAIGSGVQQALQEQA